MDFTNDELFLFYELVMTHSRRKTDKRYANQLMIDIIEKIQRMKPQGPLQNYQKDLEELKIIHKSI